MMQVEKAVPQMDHNKRSNNVQLNNIHDTMCRGQIQQVADAMSIIELDNFLPPNIAVTELNKLEQKLIMISLCEVSYGVKLAAEYQLNRVKMYLQNVKL